MKILTILIAVLPLFAHNLSTSVQKQVNRAVDIYSREHNNTGIWLLVERSDHYYKASAGLSDRENNTSVNSEQLFEIGSASKVLTGIAIFQLIEQKKLSLNTKLNNFYKDGKITKLANFKGQNYWNDVTVGMLLRHRSGFIDYLNVYNNDAKAIRILGGEEKHYTFEKIIEMAVLHGDANFKPGEKFKYCNTGYIILGDIITKVSGMDWRDYIQKNIIEKAGMNHTYFASRIPQKIRNKMPKGYADGKPTFMPPTLASSAGEIISNLEDLAKLMSAWGHGRLYKKPETLNFQMTEGLQQQSPVISNLHYGYAIMKIEGFFGHGGQTFGFESFMAYNPKKEEVYIIGTNDAFVQSMILFLNVTRIKLN